MRVLQFMLFTISFTFDAKHFNYGLNLIYIASFSYRQLASNGYSQSIKKKVNKKSFAATKPYF